MRFDRLLLKSSNQPKYQKTHLLPSLSHLDITVLVLHGLCMKAPVCCAHKHALPSRKTLLYALLVVLPLHKVLFTKVNGVSKAQRDSACVWKQRTIASGEPNKLTKPIAHPLLTLIRRLYMLWLAHIMLVFNSVTPFMMAFMQWSLLLASCFLTIDRVVF